MKLLDTDTLSLLFAAQPRVAERYRQETADVASTVIMRIEILEGRIASVMKAADGGQLLLAQSRLVLAERNLATIDLLSFDQASAATFDQLRANKKLRKIGRADLLIASLALAHQATLVTRNVKHFRQVPNLQIENWAD